MKHMRSVSVIGGDSRQVYAAERLRELGFDVVLYGFENMSKPLSLPLAETLDRAAESDIMVLPLPVTKNNKTLNASYAKREITLKELLERTDEKKTVFFGMGSDVFVRELSGTGAKFFDYYKCETLILKNALLTAEGIVGIITEKLPVSLFGLKAAVTGYGRVAGFTADILKKCGAEVTVFARDKLQRAKAETAGLKSAHTEELEAMASEFNCIINTVPAMVVNEKTVNASDKDCLFIETASAPFGIDFSACKNVGRELVKAFSLPGKVSPKTAGIMIADTIENTVKEEL